MQHDTRSERIERLRQFFLSDEQTFTASELVYVLMRPQSAMLAAVGNSVLRPDEEASLETCIGREDAYFLVYESTPAEILREAMEGIEPKWLHPDRRIERFEVALPRYLVRFLQSELARLRSLEGREDHPAFYESIADAIHLILASEFFESGNEAPPHAIRPAFIVGTTEPEVGDVVSLRGDVVFAEVMAIDHETMRVRSWPIGDEVLWVERGPAGEWEGLAGVLLKPRFDCGYLYSDVSVRAVQ